MTFLKIYLLGVLVTALLSLLTEHLYYGAGHASAVRAKDIAEDLLFSLLSWIGVLGVIIVFLGEAVTGFSNYGCGKELADFEAYLIEEKKKRESESPQE